MRRRRYNTSSILFCSNASNGTSINKTFNELYYIENTPWKRKIKDKLNNDNLRQGCKFDIQYNDIIIFNYDLLYSITKVKTTYKCLSAKIDHRIFIDAINVCLRYFNVIKQMYPYNKICVIIHIKESFHKLYSIDKSVISSIIDIIPNFAIVYDTAKDLEDFKYFDNNRYKHIFYGSCNLIKTRLKYAEAVEFLNLKGNILPKKIEKEKVGN